MRDFSNITRELDNVKNNDIIYKKSRLMEIFNSDPDLKYVLGHIDLLPNKYADMDDADLTEKQKAEKQEIMIYNQKAEKHNKDQIIDFLKVNEIQTETKSFLMFDIGEEIGYYTKSELIKNQYVTVMCFVHEDEMDTEYNVKRTDLLSYIVKDLLCWSNDTGLHMKMTEDEPNITDTKYYCRTLKFLVKAPNTSNFRTGNMQNGYARSF